MCETVHDVTVINNVKRSQKYKNNFENIRCSHAEQASCQFIRQPTAIAIKTMPTIMPRKALGTAGKMCDTFFDASAFRVCIWTNYGLDGGIRRRRHCCIYKTTRITKSCYQIMVLSFYNLTLRTFTGVFT